MHQKIVQLESVKNSGDRKLNEQQEHLIELEEKCKTLQKQKDTEQDSFKLLQQKLEEKYANISSQLKEMTENGTTSCMF